MKRLVILILTVLAINVYGQEEKKESSTTDFKRIQLGVNFSPDICFRTLKNNDGSSSSDYIVKSRNEDETVKFGYTAGINICINIKKFVGIETGIQYSIKGYQTIIQDFIYLQPDPLLPTKIKFIYNHHYIDIPLRANFTFGKNKIRFFTSVGVTTNISITETQTTILEYSGGKKDMETQATTFEYKRVNISPTISVGIDYKINSRMNLRVEPTFRYGVLKIIDTPVTAYLWNGGLNISYYFGFNKKSKKIKDP